MRSENKVIIIGFGSTALQDDGLPVWIVEQLQALAGLEGIAFLTSPVGGLDLIAMLDGFSKAVLIDTTKTPDRFPGEVCHYIFPEYSETYHLSSPHDVSFRQALELANTLRFELPAEIHIITIEICENTHLEQDFSEPVMLKLNDIIREVKDVVHLALNIEH